MLLPGATITFREDKFGKFINVFRSLGRHHHVLGEVLPGDEEPTALPKLPVEVRSTRPPDVKCPNFTTIEARFTLPVDGPVVGVVVGAHGLWIHVLVGTLQSYQIVKRMSNANIIITHMNANNLLCSDGMLGL